LLAITSSLDGKKKLAIIPSTLILNINMDGIGLSSSATMGAVTVTNRPTKLQIPTEVALL